MKSHHEIMLTFHCVCSQKTFNSDPAYVLKDNGERTWSDLRKHIIHPM